jgi:hypothetical protein
MTQQFYKDKEGWFIDLPEFIEEGHGTKGNLAMVSGADTMLDKLANNKKRITLRIETENYMFTSAEHTHRVWLCPVTKYVFGGKYPNKIYIQKVA